MWGDDMDVNTLHKGGKDCRLLLSNKHISGFTLIELVVLLSVIATIGFIIPGVSASIINNNKTATAVNKIAADMAYARSEAIMRHHNVQLCKSIDGKNCIKVKQWESGWIIFVDANQNRKRESTETLLKYQPAIKTVNITYRGSGSSHYIRFRADGATGVNGTFAFCSDSSGLHARALILFRTGRLRLSKTRSGGSAISCSSYRI